MSDITFSDDLFSEIISYLPPKEAFRSRILTQSLFKILSSTLFAQLHYQRQAKTWKYAALASSGDLFRVEFKDTVLTSTCILSGGQFNSIGGACDGLILLIGTGGGMTITNPVSRKMVSITPSPLALPPRFSHREAGLYKVEEEKVDYKVIVLSAWSMSAGPEDGYSDGTTVDVYSLRNNSWKRRPRHAFMSSPFFFHLCCISGNNVYFVQTARNGRSRTAALMSYDAEQDATMEIETPPSLSPSTLRKSSLNCVNGKLCILSGMGDPQAIWIRESLYAGGAGWIKFQNLGENFWRTPITFIKPSVLLLLNDDGELFSDDVDGSEDEAFSPSIVLNSLEKFVFVAMYVESIVDPSQF